MGNLLPLPAIVGPTAVGKTAVSFPVAEALPAEILSCDSRQVYRGMDIATAKPTAAERARITHHGLDLADPHDPFTAADFGKAARKAAAFCFERAVWPLVVGGSGLYLRALAEGLFPGPPSDPDLRAGLRAEAEAQGRPALHARLAAVDPEAAEAIHPHDLVRIVRALEVYEQGIGYRQMAEHLAGTCTMEEAQADIMRETRRYAKRQMTWFRKLPGIEWVEASDDVEADASAVLTSLRRRLPPLPSSGWARIIQAAVTTGGG